MQQQNCRTVPENTDHSRFVDLNHFGCIIVGGFDIECPFSKSLRKCLFGHIHSIPEFRGFTRFQLCLEALGVKTILLKTRRTPEGNDRQFFLAGIGNLDFQSKSVSLFRLPGLRSKELHPQLQTALCGRQITRTCFVFRRNLFRSFRQNRSFRFFGQLWFFAGQQFDHAGPGNAVCLQSLGFLELLDRILRVLSKCSCGIVLEQAEPLQGDLDFLHRFAFIITAERAFRIKVFLFHLAAVCTGAAAASCREGSGFNDNLPVTPAVAKKGTGLRPGNAVRSQSAIFLEFAHGLLRVRIEGSLCLAGFHVSEISQNLLHFLDFAALVAAAKRAFRIKLFLLCLSAPDTGMAADTGRMIRALYDDLPVCVLMVCLFDLLFLLCPAGPADPLPESGFRAGGFPDDLPGSVIMIFCLSDRLGFHMTAVHADPLLGAGRLAGGLLKDHPGAIGVVTFCHRFRFLLLADCTGSHPGSGCRAGRRACNRPAAPLMSGRVSIPAGGGPAVRAAIEGYTRQIAAITGILIDFDPVVLPICGRTGRVTADGVCAAVIIPVGANLGQRCGHQFQKKYKDQ